MKKKKVAKAEENAVVGKLFRNSDFRAKIRFEQDVKAKDSIFKALLELQRAVLAYKKTPPLPHVITAENSRPKAIKDFKVLGSLENVIQNRLWKNGDYVSKGVKMTYDKNYDFSYRRFLEWIIVKPFNTSEIVIRTHNTRLSRDTKVVYMGFDSYRNNTLVNVNLFEKDSPICQRINANTFRITQPFVIDGNTKFSISELPANSKISFEFHNQKHCPYLNEMDVEMAMLYVQDLNIMLHNYSLHLFKN